MAELSAARKFNIIEKAKKDGQERRRNILHLILSYLKEQGLEKTLETLQEEAQVGYMYEACENVDLDIILQEYQSYYVQKFQKPPKFIRKFQEDENKKQNKTPARRRSVMTIPKSETKVEKSGDSNFQFEILSLSPEEKTSVMKQRRSPELPYYFAENYTGEYKEFAEVISKEIIQETSCNFNDCIGLDEAIECLKEATIYPMEYPELFRTLDQSWSGILLYGPPGNGKTLLAKALATESRCTFINLTSSTFISKWRGESEKMLKVLFDMAKFCAPSIVFIDEIDAVTSEGNHEASRRFKSELLVQMDGIGKTADPIFVLATTNHPWSLDKATLRRFEKKILVGMPDNDNRRKLLQYYLNKTGHCLSGNEMEMIAKTAVRLSANDIKIVCKDARMSLIREKIKNKKNNANVNDKISFECLRKSFNNIKTCISEKE
ncbi:unnamed protein product [Brassicogethes aeneus]|uniref:AAA+ ATPase domain-containing protein n=1 Tax=Brassicogethes aeneus TaxID=1431903 RepID=A0A9P0FCK2_BRAAE|nr:unnamed protein product [Brassicogethes aeneus]